MRVNRMVRVALVCVAVAGGPAGCGDKKAGAGTDSLADVATKESAERGKVRAARDGLRRFADAPSERGSRPCPMISRGRFEAALTAAGVTAKVVDVRVTGPNESDKIVGRAGVACLVLDGSGGSVARIRATDFGDEIDGEIDFLTGVFDPIERLPAEPGAIAGRGCGDVIGATACLAYWSFDGLIIYVDGESSRVDKEAASTILIDVLPEALTGLGG